MPLSRVLLLPVGSNLIDTIVLVDITASYHIPIGFMAVPYEGPSGVGWTWDGTKATPPIPTDAEYSRAIQTYLDAPAKAWRYYDMASAVSYVGDPNPQYNAEATVLKAWRSAVWVKADAILAAGIPLPIADVLAQLPPPPARP